MTSNTLIQSMIEKDAFDSNTLITAKYMVKTTLGLNWSTGLFRIQQIKKMPRVGLMFDLIKLDDDAHTSITIYHIIAIDGMDPARYADVYDLNGDGSAKVCGKKRGRKPKIIKELQAEIA